MGEVGVQTEGHGGEPDKANAHAWVLEMRDPTDPYGHTARAVQRTENMWDVEYFRDGELVSDGGIGTPPPHMPPVATLMGTLQQMRQAADYWAARKRETSL